MAEDDTNIIQFLTALVAPIQDLENAIQQLLTERTVDRAIGVQLDVIGRLVKQRREGRLDDDYRRHLRARIKANRSSGIVEEWLAIAELIVYDDDAYYQIDQQGVAGAVLRVLDVAITEAVADDLISFLRDAAAAGDRPIVESSEDDPANWLVLDEGNLDEQTMLCARDHPRGVT
jgi:hypothetical protein